MSKATFYRKEREKRKRERLSEDPFLLQQYELASTSGTRPDPECQSANVDQVMEDVVPVSTFEHLKENETFQVFEETPTVEPTNFPQASYNKEEEEFQVGDRPNDIAIELGKLAQKHQLKDACLLDVIKLLRKFQVSPETRVPVNVKEVEKVLNIPSFNCTTHWKCKQCSKIFVNKGFTMNVECCECKFSQEDDHFVIFNLKEILMYTLPQVFPHIDLTNECLWDRNLRNSNGLNNEDVIITMNTDGAPLFSSSKSSLWPILAYINGTSERNKKNNILLLGLWVGKKGGKPDFDDFLAPIINQLVDLQITPLQWTALDGTNKLSRVLLSKVLCDSIARPLVMKMMQFNAQFGCCYCFHQEPGAYFKYTDGLSIPRQHKEHLLLCKEKLTGKTTEFQGVRGLTMFASLPYFDVVRGFPPDILHLLDLGITKAFTKFWLDSSNKRPCHFSEKIVQQIDTLLESVHPPCRVSKVPQGLKSLAFYKGHELNMFLLYYSPILLQDFLPKQYFDHWILLVFGISQLVKADADEDSILTAEKCIEDFAKKIESLYGHQMERFNVHLLRHLPSFVREFGSPQQNSMVCFENFNMILGYYVTSSQYVISQISRRYLRDVVLHHFEPRVYTTIAKGRVVNECHLFNLRKTYLLSNSEAKELKQGLHKACSFCFYEYIFIKGRRIHSHNYKKFKKRNNSCVLLESGNSFEIAMFLYDKTCNTVLALGEEYKLTSTLGLDHIFVSSSLGSKIYSVDCLGEILLKIEYNNTMYFVKFLNDYSHHNE